MIQCLGWVTHAGYAPRSHPPARDEISGAHKVFCRACALKESVQDVLLQAVMTALGESKVIDGITTRLGLIVQFHGFVSRVFH